MMSLMMGIVFEIPVLCWLFAERMSRLAWSRSLRLQLDVVHVRSKMAAVVASREVRSGVIRLLFSSGP